MASKVRTVIETLFNVFDKEGELVPFRLNEIQIRIDNEIIEPIEKFRESGFEYTDDCIQDVLRNSILKYRQGGVTTLVMAWYLVECMSRYSVCVMLTHDKEHSEKLLYRARLMLKHMNGPSPKTAKLNDNEISFAKTDSIFYIGTAGSKEFGRSATITHLHCSEIAFWKDPASLMKSLFQAVPKRSGVMTQETTANGWGNWLQKSFYNYRGGKGGFRAHFFPWYIHEEYFSHSPLILDLVSPDERGYERSLYKRIRKACPELAPELVRSKLQWRREKIDENEGDKDRQSAVRDFNQEYPSTIDEAFTLTGGSLFSNVRAQECEHWSYAGNNTLSHRLHPYPGYEYSLGADFSGGTGNDNSTINVVCLNTQEQVFRFADNHTNPIDFANLICKIGKYYNEAYLVPESNAHGLAGMTIVRRNYPLHRIYKHILNKTESNASRNIPTYNYGWRTSQTSKPFMVGIAQQFFYLGWKIYDALTEDELRSFTEDPETGKMDGQGAHDDCAISFMLACIGALKLMRLRGIQLFEFEGDLGVPIISTITAEAIEINKPIEVTWRGSDGTYQVPFKEVFKKKSGRRNVHA